MIRSPAQPALNGHLVQRARPNIQPAPWRVRKPGVDGIITRYEVFRCPPSLIDQGIVPMRIKTRLACATVVYPDATAQSAWINP